MENLVIIKKMMLKAIVKPSGRMVQPRTQFGSGIRKLSYVLKRLMTVLVIYSLTTPLEKQWKMCKM